MNLPLFPIGRGRGTIAYRQIAWLVLLLLSVAQFTQAQSFVHPGLLHKQADFDRMKAKVDAGAQPWKAGWDVLVANSNSSLTRNFTNPIPATVYRGFDGTNTENYASLFRDAAAAYQTAIRWKVSGDDAYAAKSIAILNAWAAGTTALSGTADRFLLAGIQGYQLANAAEIMRSYNGWAAADFTKFQNWMLTVWYPINHDFLVNHNGACISNYWANWDLCNMASMLSIGVLCDRRDIYNEAVDYFKNGAGMGSIKNVVPYVVGDLGQWQEAGRDQGHTVLGVTLAGSFAEMAWNQGDDLYGYDDNRLLKGFEYIAKYNLGYDVPFTKYSNCIGVVQTIVSEDGRGNIRPVWELVYNHYVNRKGLSAPYIARFAQIVRPEGGGGNFGPNSGGYDQLGFGTLTASLEEPVKPNSQTISFPAISAKEVGSADFSPGATASSGLPVVYSSTNPAVASVNADGTIHVAKPGTTTIVAQQMGDSQYSLAPIVTQVLTVNQIAGITDGTWSNTAGILATGIIATAGSADLTWPGQTFAVGDHVRLTGTVPGGFTANVLYTVVAANGSQIQLSLRPGGTAIVATTSITNGTGARFLKWSTATNWTNSVSPSGIGSNATFGATTFANIPGVQLDGVVTIGTLTYAANGTSELTLASGLNGGTLNFQTQSGTPLLTMINSGARKLFMGNATNNSRIPLKISGTQGLKITTPIYGSSGSYAGLRIQAAMDWSGLQGGINLAQGTIELHTPTTTVTTDVDNVLLPPTRTTMGTEATALLLFNGASNASKQTIGALDGTSDAYIASRTNVTNGIPTLVVGADNQDGTFEGTIGSGPTTAAVDKGRVNLEKIGTGTQTITGSIKNGTTTISNVPYYSTVAVNNGKLVLNGANEYQGTTTVNGGVLVVNGSLASPVSVTGGTLAGTGSTSGSVTIGTNGFIAPGNSVGTFTTTSALSLTGGATYQLELNSSASTADKLVANGVSLNNANLVITDLGNATSLPAGTSYIIIDNTSSNAVMGTFAGLAEGSVVTVGSIRFQITYLGGTGNDVALVISTQSQTITFNALPTKQVGDADFNPGATASSGLSVSYTSSNTAVATIINGNVHIVGPGSTTITAFQSGDATFAAAASVSQTLTVTTQTANRQPVYNGLLTNQSATVGALFTYTMPSGAFTDPDNDLLTYSVTGLPAGLSVNGTTISGTPGSATGSPFVITIKATDPGSLSATGSFTLTVNPSSTGSFSIAGVTGTSCLTLSANERQLTFTPQYSGTNGHPITFQITNETLPTTSVSAQPVTLKLYTDNPVINLKASQSGVNATYAYSWQSVCQPGSVTANQPPSLITPIPNLEATQGTSFNYLIPANTFSDPDGDQLTLTATGLPATLSLMTNVISGTPTAQGVYSVTVTAGDGKGLSASSIFTLAVNPAPTGSFAFAGVTGANCQILSTNERQLTFTPQYTGVNGQAITFQVVNETLPTTSVTAQPVSLKLYIDNPVINLKATQSGVTANYAYNWKTVCSGSSRVGVHTDSPLTLTALGNPVAGDQARVEIHGADGQRVKLTLTDLNGKPLFEQLIESVTSGQQQVIPMNHRAGVYLLRATSDTERTTIKLVKP
ncbi:T9SS type A sorting domain-containing protein [Spirosoma agri]|uniref:T9SS type A sorting domain-containing protein n=1 Tax=Spirosoma agri TaxID=1987381 RepID=A0A6M0INY9_9BACT|nr:putative Ig domain-containing protein [Spirosoma agri]NEU70080.1 T9SS type A sorting domain-containing protein [Spirosoma agri]